MNGVFDLGGVDGFGPVKPAPEEPVFRDEWEKVAFVMWWSMGRVGWYNMDAFRHGVELMDPAVYLTSPYYEHWLHSFERHGERTGELDMAELDRRTQYYLENPDAQLPEGAPSVDLVDFVTGASANGFSPRRPTDHPVRFAVGDRVRLSVDAPVGHTRLARYVRGKAATVIAHRGSFIYPDAHGNLLGEDPQHVYTVMFRAEELWGRNAEPNTTTTFDVWDPYIEPIMQMEGADA